MGSSEVNITKFGYYGNFLLVINTSLCNEIILKYPQWMLLSYTKLQSKLRWIFFTFNQCIEITD